MQINRSGTQTLLLLIKTPEAYRLIEEDRENIGTLWTDWSPKRAQNMGPVNDICVTQFCPFPTPTIHISKSVLIFLCCLWISLIALQIHWDDNLLVFFARERVTLSVCVNWEKAHNVAWPHLYIYKTTIFSLEKRSVQNNNTFLSSVKRYSTQCVSMCPFSLF